MKNQGFIHLPPLSTIRLVSIPLVRNNELPYGFSYPTIMSCIWLTVSCALMLFVLGGCQDETSKSVAKPTRKPVPEEPRTRLIFPQEMQVDDLTVNDFVTHAMNTCASGDYDRFRLLWSATEEPLTRGRYEQGWQAVKVVDVKLLQKIRLQEKGGVSAGLKTQTAYVMQATVRLDPRHKAGKREPNRDVIALILRENNTWRLASAPGKIREWVKEHYPADSDEPSMHEMETKAESIEPPESHVKKTAVRRASPK